MRVQHAHANLILEKRLRWTFTGAGATQQRCAAAICLVLVVLGLNLVLLWQLAVTQEEVSLLQARRTELASTRRDPAERTSRPWQGLAPKAATAWKEWEQALNQPWPSLFELLERNRLPGVLVHQLKAEHQDGELQLSARAANLELLQDWTARLRTDPRTQRLRVLKLAEQEAGAALSSSPGFEINFSLRLRDGEGGKP